MKIPSIKYLPLIGVDNIHLAAAIPRKKVNKVAMEDDFKEIHNGEKSNTIFCIEKNIIAILAGVVNFLPHPNPPLTKGGSKKFTNDLGLL